MIIDAQNRDVLILRQHDFFRSVKPLAYHWIDFRQSDTTR